MPQIQMNFTSTQKVWHLINSMPDPSHELQNNIEKGLG